MDQKFEIPPKKIWVLPTIGELTVVVVVVDGGGVYRDSVLL